MSFEFGDSTVERGGGDLDFFERVAWGDKLRTVPVERQHVHNKDAFWRGSGAQRMHLLCKVGTLVRVMDSCVTEDFQSLTAR